MHRRAGFAGSGLFAALLALALTALSSVALATGSASPSPVAAAAAPKGVPIVLGVIPDPSGKRTKWSGDQINVNLDLNGAKLDAGASTLTVNGEQITLSTPARQLGLPRPGQPHAANALERPQVRQGRVHVRGLSVQRRGQAAPGLRRPQQEGGRQVLLDVQVRRRGVGRQPHQLRRHEEMVLVHRGRQHRHRRAHHHLDRPGLPLRPLRLARTPLQEDDLQAGVGPLSEPRVHVQDGPGAHPYWIATFYTSLFRGTPLLLQIFVIYQGAPEVIKAFGLPDTYNPPAFWSGVAALSLNYGAYLTEVFRAGIQAVPKGQNEAAWAIGLSGWQTQRRIVLPQALKIVIPAVGNDFIALIKDTSLVSVITVEELLRRAQLAGSASLNNFSTLLVAAAFYWALTIFFSFWQAKLETRMARDKAREKEKGKK